MTYVHIAMWMPNLHHEAPDREGAISHTPSRRLCYIMGTLGDEMLLLTQGTKRVSRILLLIKIEYFYHEPSSWPAFSYDRCLSDIDLPQQKA